MIATKQRPRAGIPFDAKKLSISIVSHGQGELMKPLLRDLRPIVKAGAEIQVTINIPEDESFLGDLKQSVHVIRNPVPQGFGANHNQAFSKTRREWFSVLNPDIRCSAEVFAPLVGVLADPEVGVIAPCVVSPLGKVEDSVRHYPSVPRITLRVFKRWLGMRMSSDYAIAGSTPVSVDWAAGMFMLFSSRNFEEVGGFDERYFMYLEDADICRRLGRQGHRTFVLPHVSVQHDARRGSFKNAKHLRWHLTSMLTFFLTYYFNWNAH
jgi:N-acetylglucosaminyl-diphospho-decaprenol L-rhamnosyltransferase